MQYRGLEFLTYWKRGKTGRGCCVAATSFPTRCAIIKYKLQRASVDRLTPVFVIHECGRQDEGFLRAREVATASSRRMNDISSWLAHINGNQS